MSKRPSELQHLESTSRMSQVQKKKRISLGELCNAERHGRMQTATLGTSTTLRHSHSGGGYKSPITHSVLDYAEVPIPEDSVIYCDIPYINTNRYIKAKHFDYERFYQWAEQQTEPVFISSYWMPEDRFVCIAEFDHRSTLCATANNKVTERIFIPKNQKERGNTFSQPSLYDLLSL